MKRFIVSVLVRYWLYIQLKVFGKLIHGQCGIRSVAIALQVMFVSEYTKLPTRSCVKNCGTH